jgi:hypothetical protein
MVEAEGGLIDAQSALVQRARRREIGYSLEVVPGIVEQRRSVF